jgi:uncharacterized membrane protein
MTTHVNEPRETRTGDRRQGLHDTGRVDLSRSVQERSATRRRYQNVPNPERILSGLLGGALFMRGVARRSWSSWALMGLGLGLLRRAATGHCDVLSAVGADRRDLPHQSSNPLHRRMRGQASIGVQAEVDQVLEAWRDQSNLARFLAESEDDEDLISQLWEETELTKEVEGSRLSWRSTASGSPGYGLELMFSALPAGRGTRVDLDLDYLPKHGVIGAVADRFRMHGPRQRACEALRRSKRLIELGSIPSIEGQSRGQCGWGATGTTNNGKRNSR